MKDLTIIGLVRWGIVGVMMGVGIFLPTDAVTRDDGTTSQAQYVYQSIVICSSQRSTFGTTMGRAVGSVSLVSHLVLKLERSPGHVRSSAGNKRKQKSREEGKNDSIQGLLVVVSDSACNPILSRAPTPSELEERVAFLLLLLLR
ncbi:uncharacterized protein BO95DRAFT_281633 [Aspergillus brunneoviolaceus CBS 621.78]|uniref:Uncharacterized protein n=1 Tax=Aspergillus brunneoviolaceus CBS 621.78 TaxID=1450534 RepID=A0ACD1FV80_9EURO|nr:hypothetical protein BO95DRAFT_281633 [Aspergillus brunneoviolaceus CBS 621.78]RAH40864.1 hypothetical protein BO95DRAFT_281633 [Aspergillus brunneoviolaceus CBS 621.78]